MVDALQEAHRVLASRGVLVDARPDSRVLARVRSGPRVVGTVETQRETKTDDRLSDHAVRHAIRGRLFRSVRRGRLWHRIPFADRADLQRYLDEHLRFSSRVRWRVAPARRTGPLEIERAVRYEVLLRR